MPSARGEATSVGLVGNCADVIPELAERGVVPDLLTDQTSAHDPHRRLRSQGMTLSRPSNSAKRSAGISQALLASPWPSMSRACSTLQKLGSCHLRLRQQHPHVRLRSRRKERLRFPGFVPAYIRPLFCEGTGPFRWAALSGEPSDIRAHRSAGAGDVPGKRHLNRWISLAQKHVNFQGLPSRICWLGYGERENSAWLSTTWSPAVN